MSHFLQLINVKYWQLTRWRLEVNAGPGCVGGGKVKCFFFHLSEKTYIEVMTSGYIQTDCSVKLPKSCSAY